MDDGHLPTEVWLKAHLRRCHAAGIPVFVLHRGDPDRGTILVKISRLDGRARMLTQTRDLDGRLGWMATGTGAELTDEEADDYIRRTRRYDPDLWVVEVEDREGRNPFDGPEV